MIEPMATRAEPTALLSLMAIAIAALIGVPCGIVSETGTMGILFSLAAFCRLVVSGVTVCTL